jgi:serine/threonine-protein kinase
MQAHLNSRPPELAEVRPEIPFALSQAIARAMAKDPRNRFASAREFMGALEGNDDAVATMTSAIPIGGLETPSRNSSQKGSGSVLGKISSSTEQLPEALEEMRKHLAEFIGPIAKVVIRRLAPRCPDLDELYREAAKEIASEKDRQKFLRMRTVRR